MAIVGAVIVAIAGCSFPHFGVRDSLLTALRPVRLSNCTFKRVGHPHDGGYVMCANLLDDATVGYSYGVDNRDDWGCEISKTHHVKVHEYDCFNTKEPACEGGQLAFHAECVGPAAQDLDGRHFDSVAHQIERNGDAGKKLVVKMDVEGAEWDSLMATPDDVLDRFEQLTMEFHGVNDAKFLAVIEKLKKTFYIVNVHVNNYSCEPWVWPFPGSAYEVALVNHRIGKLSPDTSPAETPNPLDTVNHEGETDCQIHWK